MTSEADAGDFSNPATLSEVVEKNSRMRLKAFANALDHGSQIINLSGFFGPESFNDCSQQQSQGNAQPFCDWMQEAKDLDVVFVASNGNHRGGFSNWPANETGQVIGVGGIDSQGRIWDDLVNHGSCPNGSGECGTQLGGNPLILAPARNIRVYHECGTYDDDCGDNTNESLYFSGKGTSFAAPIISGIVAIMRSINPLSSFDEVRDNLYNSRVMTVQGYTFSVPNIHKILKNYMLGHSNGVKVANRVKPMFRLRTWFYENQNQKYSYLSTSIPQVAVSAIKRKYLADIEEDTGLTGASVTDSVDTNEPLALGYPSFRGSGGINNARAPFYIFGGHENPFTGADDMIPLHHFGYKEPKGYTGYPKCTNKADHGYATALPTEFVVKYCLTCGYPHTTFVSEGLDCSL